MVMKSDVIKQATDLEQSLRQLYSADTSKDLYTSLLDEYTVLVWALLSIGDGYPWERLLSLEEAYGQGLRQLSSLSATEYDDMLVTGDLLAVLSGYTREALRVA